MDYLKCNKCLKEKVLSEFHLAVSTRRGYRTICKTCTAESRSVEAEMIRNVRARAKARGQEFDLTIEFLRDLRNLQNNVCPYCGFELNWEVAPVGKQRMCPPDRASLDRIDSAKGYTQDNVQLVTDFCNRIKTWYPHRDIVGFCRAVSERFPE